MSTTSENNKRIAKNTMLLYIRMLFTMAVTLYTSRVVLNTLGVEDFGIYNVVGGVVMMFAFLNGAMASSTQRFLTFELGTQNTQNLQKIFSTSLSIHGMISILLILLAETIGLWFLYTQMTIPEGRMSAALWVYQFSVLACVVMVMSAPYNAVIIAHEKMSAFAYISVLEVVLKLLIVYILVVFSFDKLKLYAVLMFFVQMIVRLLYGKYCNKHFPETKYTFVWDKSLFKNMTDFAGWSLFGEIAVIAYSQGVNLLLNIFFGPVVNAARGISMQVNSAVSAFSANFQVALNPQITKSYAAKDLTYMHSLIFRSSTFSFFLLLFLSLPILIETEFILKVWLKTVPDYTTNFVRITLGIVLINSLSNPLINAAKSTGRIRTYQAVIGSILLLILPVSYICLKAGMLPDSVYWVNLIIVCIAQIVRIGMIRPMIKLSLREYFSKVVLRILPVFAGSLILPIILSNLLPSGWETFFIVSLSCLISVAICVYYIGLTKGEKDFIHKKVLRFIHKRDY